MATMPHQLRTKGRCKHLQKLNNLTNNRLLYSLQKLTIHIPFSNDIWFKKAFEYLKQNPHNLPQPGQTSQQNTRGGGREKNARTSQIEEEDLANQMPAYFTGP